MHTPCTIYHHSQTNHHYASHTPAPHHIDTHPSTKRQPHSPTTSQPISQDHYTPAMSYITRLPKQPQHTTAIYPHSDTCPLLSLTLSCSFFFLLSLFLSCFLFFLSLFPLYLLLYSMICYSTLLHIYYLTLLTDTVPTNHSIVASAPHIQGCQILFISSTPKTQPQYIYHL